tara:strand:+ start:88 stop:852 length:765 start_codon:yes stop_codon:yes gene_type:complete
MPPAKRPRFDPVGVFVDSVFNDLNTDDSGVRVTLAHHTPTDMTYLLKREWVERTDMPKKAIGYIRTDGFKGNVGTSSWSITEVSSPSEIDDLVKDLGHANKIPYVYVMSHPRTCDEIAPGVFSEPILKFKIGASFDLDTRRKTLQTGNSLGITLLKRFVASDTRGDVLGMFQCERSVHKALSAFGGPYADADFNVIPHHIRGGTEWFGVTDKGPEEVVKMVAAAIRTFRTGSAPLTCPGSDTGPSASASVEGAP